MRKANGLCYKIYHPSDFCAATPASDSVEGVHVQYLQRALEGMVGWEDMNTDIQPKHHIVLIGCILDCIHEQKIRCMQHTLYQIKRLGG